MTPITTFKELTTHLSGLQRRLRVAIVQGTDSSTRYAVRRATDAGFVEPVFVGGREELDMCPEIRCIAHHVTHVETNSPKESAEEGVRMVREGRADILMKGLIKTDELLHAVLNKEQGILPRGRVLTHIACAQIPQYGKMLFLTDAAVIPFPTPAQRIEQVRYVVELCHKFGIAAPKVALTHCTEKVNVKTFPFTADYKDVVAMGSRGDFGQCVIDGPLDVKTACHVESMEMKGICSPIQGEADALVFPDIEAGNTFYKTITLFGGAETASMLQGTTAPVVLTSRADSPLTKYYSLALAAIASQAEKGA